MNAELRSFGKRFQVGKAYPANWFRSFVADYLYKSYYAYASRLTHQHSRKFQSALSRDLRQYKRLKNKWPKQKTPYLKAA